MTFDALTIGERWLVEALSHVEDLRGWRMANVSPVPMEAGAYRVRLVDRYGRVYRYRLHIELDEDEAGYDRGSERTRKRG